MRNIIRKYKTSSVYLGISILCLIIFLIYDQFSHGVRSPYMTYLFLWPLVLGFVPYTIAAFIKSKTAAYGNSITRIAFNIYNSGVAAITVSSLLKGIFDIAGNSSIYQSYLMTGGIIILIVGIIIYPISLCFLKASNI